MAQASVGFLMQKLADLVVQEAAIVSGIHSQVSSVEREFQRMQCFLKDADAKRKGDERVKNWVKEVREVAHDTEDIIDAFILRMRVRPKSSVRRCVFFLDEWIARHRVFNEIEQIRIKTREISESRVTYGIENLGTHGEGISSSSKSLQERRRSSPFAEELDVVGFDEDVKLLVSHLTSEETRRSVISIVGMGGSGKTTLAKKVYNCENVKRHFDCRAWVYVSQEYKARELLLCLAKKVTALRKDELAMMNEHDLKEELWYSLRNRRYLIVMDDIWKTEVWADLRVAFPEVTNGSRILFTSRIRDVALHADPSSSPHELQLLSMDQGWELFTRKVFLQSNCPPEMEKLGRQIVEKCGGLPLAIVVVGGLLSRKEKTVTAWRRVLGSLNWQLAQDPEQFSEILALSYNDLPHYLKSCFLYLGTFPEDFEINARKLIQLWAAEGFLQQVGDRTIEEVGEEHLEELVCRSIVQIAKRRSDGGIKTCRIHDLLRDLAILEAKGEEFLGQIYANTDLASLMTTRRIVIHNRIDKFISLSQSNSRVRSLLCFTKETEELLVRPLKFLCRGLRMLRVLELESVSTSRLPKEIGDLIHLRYLRLRRMGLDSLPSSIVNLQNLQTLDIRSRIINLPNAIWKLQHLRHLYLHPVKLQRNPRHILLPNLQTLSVVQVGSWTEFGLLQLTNLRKLGLKGPLSLYEKELSQSISKLCNLRSLKLEADSGDFIPLTSFALPDHSHLYKLVLNGCLYQFLDCHELPPNLTKLSLTQSYLGSDSFEIIEKLPNLRVLQLLPKSYVEEKMICSRGGFARLETFELGDLPALEEWVVEEGAMPKLRQLLVFCCFELKGLPEGLQHVTTLEELNLWEMGSKFDSSFREDQEWNKIKHIPSINIRKEGDRHDQIPSVVVKTLGR